MVARVPVYKRAQVIYQIKHICYTGCHLSLGTTEAQVEAQKLFDTIPALLERKKIGGRDLPTETFIKKKGASFGLAGFGSNRR